VRDCARAVRQAALDRQQQLALHGPSRQSSEGRECAS
jgi:hypothetical protein